MNNAELHLWLHKELPATTAEIQQRLDLLHRMMPAGFKDWPTNAELAMQKLLVDGLVEMESFQWRWVGKSQMKEALLFE